MQFFSLVRNDLKSRFSGSRLGLLWALAGPGVTVGIYWFVYTVVLGGSQVVEVPYLSFLVAGILPWFFVSEGLLGASSVFRDYRFLVCNLRFRAEQLPRIRVTSGFLIHLVLTVLSYGVLLGSGVTMKMGQWLVLFWMAGGFCLCLALGRMFALWNACCPDVGYGLNVAIQLGFWLTPVFWSSEALPEPLYRISIWNPVATLVEGYREALLYGTMPELSHLLIFWGEVLVLYGLSCLLMKKIRPTLADRL